MDCKPLETKYKAIKTVEVGKKKKIEIATEFGIKQNTLSTWLKQKELIKAWVKKLDIKMVIQKWKISLIMDNGRVHPDVKALKAYVDLNVFSNDTLD